MVRRIVRTAIGLVLIAAVSSSIALCARDTLPASLSDRDFWALTERFSEPNGYFVSQSGSPDNLLSNEIEVSTVAAALAKVVRPSGVYLGVGPEQNFTYIAAMRPRVAFVIDIRRGNLNLHLLYKALFELSSGRGDFVARLFNRKPLTDVSHTAGAADLMSALERAEPVDDATFKANLKVVTDHLTKTHGFPLSSDDLTGVEYVYRNFYRFGPDINYTSSINGRTGSRGTYAAIMSATDGMSGAERTYLADDGNFTFVKALETKNLIVPVVGDFAGPKALRAVGTYLREHGAGVTAFYVSNVEMYLRRNGVWDAFCANAASLPLDESSIFIHPGGRGGSMFGSMRGETYGCAK